MRAPERMGRRGLASAQRSSRDGSALAAPFSSVQRAFDNASGGPPPLPRSAMTVRERRSDLSDLPPASDRGDSNVDVEEVDIDDLELEEPSLASEPLSN